MATTPLFVSAPRTQLTLFVPGHGTRPRVIFSPGTSGSIVNKIMAASTDGSANNVQLGHAEALTLQSNMGTGSLVDNGGSADTITRTSGSYVTDGWLVGDRLMVQGATTLANDFEVVLTAVTSTTLTLATGGGTVNTAEDLPSGAKLYRLVYFSYIDLAANAGSSSTAGVSLLDETKAPALNNKPQRTLQIQDSAAGNEMVIAASLATALGIGETVDITVEAGDY